MDSFELAYSKVARQLGLKNLTHYLSSIGISEKDIEDLARKINTVHVAVLPSGQNASIGKKYKLAGKILAVADTVATVAYPMLLKHGKDLYNIPKGSDLYNKLNCIEKGLRDFVSADAPKLGLITPSLTGYIALAVAWAVALGLYFRGRDKEKQGGKK